MKTIYTVAYGDPVLRKQRRIEDFLDLLAANEVSLIADLRFLASGGFGTSPYNGQTLGRHLEARGIRYERFRELGNPERGDPTLRRFRELMRTEGTERLDRLIGCIEGWDGRLALMCACPTAETCHRSVVARALRERIGCEIVDL